MRRKLVRWSGDALVQGDWLGRSIAFPLSHNLLLYQRERKEYSANLARVSAAILAKYPDLRAVDVGGNIGDSVLMMRSAGDFPILTIEGDERFHECLVANTTSEPNVVIEPSFVLANDNAELMLVRAAGTGRLTSNQLGSQLAERCRSLEAILRDYPEFVGAKLLKIDTDGMDFTILNSALGWLSRARPLLFFEWDPGLSKDHRPSGIEVLQSLASHGYCSALVWDNHGKFLLGASLQHTELFIDLDAYVGSPKEILYWDVCCFHKEDNDVFVVMRVNERTLEQRGDVG